MKKLLMLLIGSVLIATLTGCGTTRTEEYVKYKPGTDIVIEKGTRTTDESAFGLLMEEMKIKDIAWWLCGWYFKITCTFTGQDTYFPNFTIRGGKINKGHISLTKDSQQDLYRCIRAMQMPISVSISKDGAKISEQLTEEEKEFLTDTVKDHAEDNKEKTTEVINGGG